MRKKLRDASGLTLVELLCGIVILVLLGLLVNAGIGVAAKSYRELTAAAETQLLLSTAADALAGELRFAQEVTAEAGRLTSYRSPSFGARTTLELKEGRILAGGRHLLPPGWQSGDGYEGGAYRGEAYKVRELDIQWDETDGTFHISLKVVWTGDEGVGAETELAVRCLNGPGKTEEGETPP